MNTPFSLKGKTILVTGASSGIGKAVAIQCSIMGACVYITARNKERLKETLSLMAGEGHQSVVAELTNQENRNELVSLLPELDGVVHCAGVAKTKLFQFVTETDQRELFDINYFAPVLFTKELLKAKRIKSQSSLVFISSISGTVCTYLGNSTYTATKAAINGAVKGMAVDLASKMIRVNAISPGMIDTAILDNSSITKEQLDTDMQKYPLKRYGKPEEVAYATLYLLSDATKWMTGTNLVIDGGFTLL